jgi:hypothetical protein
MRMKVFSIACLVLVVSAHAQIAPQVQPPRRGPVMKPQVPPMPVTSQQPVFQQPMPVYSQPPLFQPPVSQQPMFQQSVVQQPIYPQPVQYGLNCYAGNLVGPLGQAAPIGLSCSVFTPDGSQYAGVVGQ